MNFLLKPEELKPCEASNRMHKVIKQTNHLMGTFGPLLGFLEDRSLRKAIRSFDVNYYEHQALLRGLMRL
ncbi:hypothetical protein [Rickettsiella endosymbiont of Aleochara curtula]|uniref:hypothetical protein n=1 Tax=Rickettsiella endosymbiont of Aleochara curtula TaxID=3077936 RepID=UPI00313EE051